MQVRDGMTNAVLTVRPDHTLRRVAGMMADRGVGAAIVLDPDGAGPAIITERDILKSIGAGEDPDTECVRDHHADDMVTAEPSWSLERAASEMIRRRFRHLVVVEGGDVTGVLSMRDIVRVWTTDGATCDIEATAA
jgi:signal-transduction protein with cAMP-binding, CBS, and nucleotidyltransferase domain